MPANTPFVHVSGPRFTPLKYGLLSAAEVVDDPDPHWRIGTQFQPEACAPDKSVAAFCLAGGPATGTAPKTPTATGAPSSAAEPFTVYAFVDCSPVGWGDEVEDLQDRAIRQLDSGEGRAVERVFWTGAPDGGPVVYPHLAADSVVDADDQGAMNVQLQSAADELTAATSVVGAMAALEGGLADCYGGEGVIHVPASLVAYLKEKSLVEVQGPNLRSPMGHKVAAYSPNLSVGPDGTESAAGSYWMYATGAVIARRGLVKPTGRRPAADFVDRSSNSTVFVVERTYAIDWDCCHIAVEVTPT